MSKFTPPYRVGRSQGRAVLDSKGLEVVIFPVGQEEEAKKYCDFINREPISVLFEKWLKDTNRSGGVLYGTSVREFIKSLGDR